MTKLNIANIDKVINTVNDENKFFSMGRYWCYSFETRNHRAKSYESFDFDADEDGSSDCGTPACICGWSNHIRLTENGDSISEPKLCDEDSAGDWLGLNEDESAELFRLSSLVDHVSQYNVTRANVIAVLENLKKTGQVDWKVTLTIAKFSI